MHVKCHWWPRRTGNAISSAYTLTQSVTNTYSMSETADNTIVEGTGESTVFTLTETGSWTGTFNNNGNSIEGNYANSTAGSDSYTMTDTGTNLGVSFSETVVGSQITGSTRPPIMSPPGAGRQGAFNAAKRASGVPESMQPSRVLPNVDRPGNSQPGRIYEFDVPQPGGETRTVRILDDSGGHNFGPNDPQNRGPHFNDEAGNHFDY